MERRCYAAPVYLSDKLRLLGQSDRLLSSEIMFIGCEVSAVAMDVRDVITIARRGV